MNWVSQGFFWLVAPRFSVGCAFQNAHLLLSDFVDIRSTRPHTHMCACVCRGVGGADKQPPEPAQRLAAEASRNGARMTLQAPEQGIPASANFAWPVCVHACARV